MTPDAIQKAYEPGNGALGDAFVAKFDPNLAKLIYSTLLGSEVLEGAIAVDEGGDAYVVGSTESARFPTTPGAFQTSPPLASRFAVNGFAAKIQPSDFSMSLTPEQVSLAPGASATVNISVAKTGGFVGPAEITPPNPSGLGIRLDPSAIASTDSAVSFTLNVKAFTASGQYSLVFAATDSRGVISHSAVLNLTVLNP
ncbi:MAG TPA: hypothetical protein VI756_06050 [Blastocatellia bacterium]